MDKWQKEAQKVETEFVLDNRSSKNQSALTIEHHNPKAKKEPGKQSDKKEESR